MHTTYSDIKTRRFIFNNYELTSIYLPSVSKFLIQLRVKTDDTSTACTLPIIIRKNTFNPRGIIRDDTMYVLGNDENKKRLYDMYDYLDDHFQEIIVAEYLI